MSSAILLSEIKQALNNNEFLLFYQPQVSFLTGKLAGVEALLRWKRPDNSLVGPDLFIPQAEQSGLIKDITQHLIPILIQDAQIIHDLATDPIEISVNISAQDLEDETVISQIVECVKNSDICPELLNIEITEGAVLNPSKKVLRNFHILNAAKLTISMDDYGKSYSNLSSLAQWPFSSIKLDQEFVAGMEKSSKHATIVTTTIRMAHELGVSVVAEGIETEKTYHLLLDAGCTKAQGYWIAKPMPLAELLLFIKQDKQWPGSPIGLLRMVQHDHIQWRTEVIQIVGEILQLGHIGDRVHIPEMSHFNCNLGKWYYGLGQQYKQQSSFVAIEEYHIALHHLGTELIKLAHDQNDNKNVVTVMRELSKMSTKLLRDLQELEHDIMLDDISI